MTFKPLLADNCENPSQLKFPVLASKKLDGIRCMKQNGKLVSRTLKPIPNENIQKKFANLPEGADGELIVGDPCAKNEAGDSIVFRNTTSIVMSSSKPADDVRFFWFDLFSDSKIDQGYLTRLNRMHEEDVRFANKGVVIVGQTEIKNADELAQIEEAWLLEGYEGVMVRAPQGRYKQGRSHVGDGILLKVKRFEDAEATITGSYEKNHNANEEFTNELGRTARSSAKAGMVPMGVLGGFFVTGLNGVWDGVEFKVGGGFDDAERAKFWKDREAMVGTIIKYKWFTVGSKDKPRFPGFLGIRDREDM